MDVGGPGEVVVVVVNRTDPEAKRRELPFFVLSPVCGSVTGSEGAWSVSGPPSLPSLPPG